jgi:hypothetical protein
MAINAKSKKSPMIPTIKALLIIKNHPEIHGPRDFARLMWPNSPAWRHYTKCGSGVHRGGGMYLAAGGFLGKLIRAGLIRQRLDQKWKYHYSLTDVGLAQLREALDGG